MIPPPLLQSLPQRCDLHLTQTGQTLLQSPGPAIILSVHPSTSVVVGRGFFVGSPDEQVRRMAGQAQISVLWGPTVAETVVVGSHQCSPGRVVCLARSEAALVHVAQLPQPGLSKTCNGSQLEACFDIGGTHAESLDACAWRHNGFGYGRPWGGTGRLAG